MQRIKTNLKFYCTSVKKSTFFTQNDTDSANFWCTADKKYFILSYRKFYFAEINIGKLYIYIYIYIGTIFRIWYEIYHFTAHLRENQLSARKMTPTRLTFSVRRTKKKFLVSSDMNRMKINPTQAETFRKNEWRLKTLFRIDAD